EVEGEVARALLDRLAQRAQVLVEVLLLTPDDVRVAAGHATHVELEGPALERGIALVADPPVLRALSAAEPECGPVDDLALPDVALPLVLKNHLPKRLHTPEQAPRRRGLDPHDRPPILHR